MDIGSLPEEVLKASGVAAALNALAKLPSLDLDGWPSLISAAELDLAEGSASVGTDGKAGLETLRSQV